MAYTQNLESAQADKLQKRAMDTMLQGNAGVFLVVTNNPGRFKGKNIKKSIITSKNTSGGGFSGMASFTNSLPQTKQSLVFEPGRRYKPVVIDQSEIDVNAIDPEAAFDMKKEAMEEAANSLADDFGGDFYGLGDGVVSQGLRTIIDDGTEAATYGGITRSTLSNNNLDAYFYDANATLSSSNDQYVDTAFTSATIANESPDLIITTKNLWNIYKGLLSVQYQINPYSVGTGRMSRFGLHMGGQGQGVNVSYAAINYAGAPMIFDDKCPAYYMFFLNRKNVRWYGLPTTAKSAKPVSFGANAEIEGVYAGMKSENIGLSFRGFFEDPERYGEVGQLIHMGQLISFDPRRGAKLLFN